MKLAARARDLPALARALAARAGEDVNIGRSRLVSTYFDTPDRTLARQGLALRVRQRDGDFVQTVKSDASGGPAPFARGEWEDTIAGEAPDPRAPESGRFFCGDTAGRLAPLFRTEIARRTIALSAPSGALIEAAIDRGRIRAAASDAGEPVSEVELELKCGRPAALYDMALDLLEVAPLRLERRSKAERGYRLAVAGAPPVAAVHARTVALDRGMSGSEALQRIGFSCLEQILQNEAAVLAGLGEGLHQMRVAVRRLRAVLSAFGALLSEEQRRQASDELRWLGDALGAARNFDVFEAALLAPAEEAGCGAGNIAALRAVAERRRRAAYVEAAAAVRSRQFTRLLLRLLRWFETCGWREDGGCEALDEPVAAIAARVLDRRRRVVKGRSKGLAGQSPRQRHELRIAVKKLRYAAETLAAIYDAERVARFTKRLKRLQNDLGDANDVRVGHGIVVELARQNGAPAIVEAGADVLAWHERRLGRREPKLRRHLTELLDSRPFWPDAAPA